MIILPDRNICRTKVLVPVPKREWMPPSHAQPKTAFGHEDRVQFRLRSRLSDGYVTWQGWFDDRNDADAFLYAIAMGDLVSQPDIWRLPTPMWHPDFGVDVTFEFATTVSLTTTGTANTWTVPSDWTSADNRIHCIGAGGGGAVVRASSAVARYASGAGAGGYGSSQNVSLTPGASITYGVGAGGAFVRRTSTTGDGVTNGNAGGDTYFNAASYAAASIGGQGGTGGAGSTTSVLTSGGTGGGGKGTFNFSGGNGGTISAVGTYVKALGGGGAAGPNGNGNPGANSATAQNSYNVGGSGDAGFGGAVPVGIGADGLAGTEISNGLGSGSGGNGYASISTSATGGDGGSYGGAGAGAAGSSTITSGAGKQGIIILVYNPKLFSFNLAMMGM